MTSKLAPPNQCLLWQSIIEYGNARGVQVWAEKTSDYAPSEILIWVDKCEKTIDEEIRRMLEFEFTDHEIRKGNDEIQTK